MEEKQKEKDTTMKQEVFCQEYVDEVGTGVWAAIKAFDIKGKEVLDIKEKDRTDEQKEIASKVYNTAGVMANEYLRKPKIIKRIDEILEERGFTDETVKREHFKLIKNGDEGVKMRAIESYYKLKGKNEEKDNEVNIKIVQYGDSDTTQVQTEGVPDTNI